MREHGGEGDRAEGTSAARDASSEDGEPNASNTIEAGGEAEGGEAEATKPNCPYCGAGLASGWGWFCPPSCHGLIEP